MKKKVSQPKGLVSSVSWGCDNGLVFVPRCLWLCDHKPKISGGDGLEL
jgi:hypothetical protein